MNPESGASIDAQITYIACGLAYVALHLAILVRRPPRWSWADWHTAVTIAMVGVPLTVAAVIVIVSLFRS